MKKNKHKKYSVPLQSVIDTARGNLHIGENYKHIPFAIKRFYIINNIPQRNAVRGMHAHKKIDQAIFCVNGSFDLHMDNGNKKWKIAMNDPAHGVLVKNKIWHHMTNFSKDCVIFVAASDYYKENDYIRDYNEFIKLI